MLPLENHVLVGLIYRAVDDAGILQKFPGALQTKALEATQGLPTLNPKPCFGGLCCGPPNRIGLCQGGSSSESADP